MSVPRRDREGCIKILDKWIKVITNTAVGGELKLTEKGTWELRNNLAWVRNYLQDLDEDKVDEVLNGIKMPPKVEVDELPDKPPFKEAEYAIYELPDGEYIWYEGKWEKISNKE